MKPGQIAFFQDMGAAAEDRAVEGPRVPGRARKGQAAAGKDGTGATDFAKLLGRSVAAKGPAQALTDKTDAAATPELSPAFGEAARNEARPGLDIQHPSQGEVAREQAVPPQAARAPGKPAAARPARSAATASGAPERVKPGDTAPAIAPQSVPAGPAAPTGPTAATSAVPSAPARPSERPVVNVEGKSTVVPQQAGRETKAALPQPARLGRPDVRKPGDDAQAAPVLGDATTKLAPKDIAPAKDVATATPKAVSLEPVIAAAQVPLAPQTASAAGVAPARTDRRLARPAIDPKAARTEEAQAAEGERTEAKLARPAQPRPNAVNLFAQQAVADNAPAASSDAPKLGLPAETPRLERPRNQRVRDPLLADEERPAEERKLAKVAADVLPNLLLVQLSAPLPPPPADLVNARLQALAREGRRGLEGSAVGGLAGPAQESVGAEAKNARNERDLPLQGPSLTMPVDGPPPQLPTAPPPVAEAPAVPPLPPAAAPLLEHAALDPGLNVALLPKAAHMTITNGDGRALELHVRLSPEGADIRAAGNLAPMVQANVAELGMALASQGLTLGSFEMSRDGGGRSSRDRDEEIEDRHSDDSRAGNRRVGRASSPTGGGSVTNVAGRIHVKV